MRSKVVEGKAYPCPMYLVRSGAGWQVRLPGEASKFFADRAFGGVDGSYEGAVAFRREKMPITEQVRPMKLKETASKVHRTGMPGVFLQKRLKKGRDAVEYFFSVTQPGKGRVTVYIGGESTWQQNYDAKLARAVDLREKVTEKQIVSG